MPLTFNSPRASPFQRPSSPSSATPPMNRTSTTPSSSGRNTSHTPTASPSKLKQSYTAADVVEESSPPSPTPTARPFIRSQTEPPPAAYPSPSRQQQAAGMMPLPSQSRQVPSDSSSQPLDTTLLSRLPQPLVHSLRETFALLDTSHTNTLTPQSIITTFQSLSLPPPTPAELSAFFPTSGPQTISLPVFLNTLASLLTQLSPSRELLDAFSAFDEGDTGEIDVDELRSSVLNTVPDTADGGDGRSISARDFEKCMEGWTGRRAFVGGRHGGHGGLGGLKSAGGGSTPKKGEVFRYQDFVGSLMSGGFGIGNDAGQTAGA